MKINRLFYTIGIAFNTNSINIIFDNFSKDRILLKISMKDECYEFIRNQIGKPNIVGFGSYGEVKIAKNTENKQIVAIKLVKNLVTYFQIHGKNAKEQIDVHHKLNHPNIIKLLNYYYEKDKNLTYMVLQYAQKGSLNQKIKYNLGLLSKELVQKYFKHVCEAVKYLHSHNYMHRDIKPQNVLITKDDKAKLCDFGFAAIFDSRTTICGTFEYMAPQMIKKKHYSYKIDIWALGILLFQMIQGVAPFKGQTGQQVITEMKKPIKFSNRFESIQIDLIKKILRVNSQNRPDIQEILSHAYFKDFKQQQTLTNNSSKQNLKLFDQKKSSKAQSPHVYKQRYNQNSAKQDLKRFLKKGQENYNQLSKKGDKNKFQDKQKSNLKGNYNIKTEPSIIVNKSEGAQSYSYRDGKNENFLQINSNNKSIPNNGQKYINASIQNAQTGSYTDIGKKKQFRKYSNNSLAVNTREQKNLRNLTYSPKPQNKTAIQPISSIQQDSSKKLKFYNPFANMIDAKAKVPNNFSIKADNNDSPVKSISQKKISITGKKQKNNQYFNTSFNSSKKEPDSIFNGGNYIKNQLVQNNNSHFNSVGYAYHNIPISTLQSNTNNIQDKNNTYAASSHNNNLSHHMPSKTINYYRPNQNQSNTSLSANQQMQLHPGTTSKMQEFYRPLGQRTNPNLKIS